MYVHIAVSTVGTCDSLLSVTSSDTNIHVDGCLVCLLVVVPCRDYRKCYQLILDVLHVLPDHLLEFKVVGGFCSYKVRMYVCTYARTWASETSSRLTVASASYTNELQCVLDLSDPFQDGGCGGCLSPV